MTINWPLNGWFKKLGGIHERCEKRRAAGMMNNAPCEISQVLKKKIAASSPLQHLQKMKTNKNEELNLKLRNFSKI